VNPQLFCSAAPASVPGQLLLVMVQYLMMAALLAAALRWGMLHHFVVAVLLVQVFQMPMGQGQAGYGEQSDQ